MAVVPIALAKRTNKGRGGIEGASKLENCYLEEIGGDARAPEVIYPIDGLTQWSTVATSTGGTRAFLPLDSNLIAVIGRQVVSFDLSGVARVLGGFATDGNVTMARNRRDVPQVAICCGGEVAVVSGGALSHVTDPDLPPATSIDCLDGYLLALMPDGRFFASALDDVTSWDALSFAKAEANPDGGVRVKVRNREAVVYGQFTTEFWNNIGEEPFPLGRVTSVDIGCLAGGSVCDLEQTHVFIAHDSTVRRWNGYTAERISSHDVERTIEGDSGRANITGFSWTAHGHAFYAITGTDWTKVYDARTGMWHDASSYGFGGRWRRSAAVRFADKLIFGVSDAGDVFEASRNVYDEDGDPIIMTMQTPPVHAWPQRLRWNSLHVGILPGVGTNTSAPQDFTPSIMVDWSDDGGHTWSAQRTVEVGQQGHRLSRVVTRRMGVSPQAGRTVRLSMSAAVARGVMGLAADIEKLEAP